METFLYALTTFLACIGASTVLWVIYNLFQSALSTYDDVFGRIAALEIGASRECNSVCHRIDNFAHNMSNELEAIKLDIAQLKSFKSKKK